MEIFGIDLFNAKDFGKLLFKFGIDFFFVFIAVRVVFYKDKSERDYLFTFFIFNILTFFICYLLRKVPMEMGFALGLFAVFGILRYRTEALPIREMTYLFIVIGLAMINALSNKTISMFELIFTNAFIVGTAFAIDKIWFNTNEIFKQIIFEKIDLIKPEKNTELIADLKERTGLDVTRVEIGKIDFLRDTANVKIFYHEEE
jgi:hypothetical protein